MDHKDLLIELLLEKKNNPKVEVSKHLESSFIGKICMVRTYSAGVFYGELVAKVNEEGRLKNARRVWYWNGAASLSELATEGTNKPDLCKFPITVDSVELTKIIEIIPMTEKAISSLNGVKIWSGK